MKIIFYFFMYRWVNWILVVQKQMQFVASLLSFAAEIKFQIE